MDLNPHIELKKLRKQIDIIDKQIIENIEKRMAIIGCIAKLKTNNNIDVLQKSRWKEMNESRKIWAKRKGISKSFIENIFQLVHEESVKLQSKLLKG